MTDFELHPSQKEFFDREGYVVVRELLNQEELSVIREAVENPDGITKYAFERDDGKGLKSKMALFNYPGDDIT
jgi:ectoine hydroxylase-related dioxygenase (phytanoyl-CoA dioxygenase family)